MNGFWKQNRILISIVTVFLVLGIAPLVVMRFFPSEQPKTALPETESEGTSIETAVEDVDQQRPFSRFLETSQEEIEEAKNENKNVEDTDLIISARSGQILYPIIQQPETNSEVPVKTDAISIIPPFVPTDNVDKKNVENPQSPPPKPADPEPVKTEPPKPEIPKPEPVKTEPIKTKTAKTETNKTKSTKKEPNKIITTNNSLELIPFLYFYQQSRSGHQTVILFPVTPEHAPVVFETKPTPAIVPVIPIVPVMSIQPVYFQLIYFQSIYFQPVYTPFIVPIIEYYPPLL